MTPAMVAFPEADMMRDLRTSAGEQTATQGYQHQSAVAVRGR